MIAWWKIEPKDTTAILALILSVVTFLRTPADAEVCGRIGFDAFTTLANKHNFPPDFPAPEHSVHVLSMMFSHPSFFCVVAEQAGKVIGSNCLDERAPIAGVGPITIDPAVQFSYTLVLSKQLPDYAFPFLIYRPSANGFTCPTVPITGYA